MWRLRSDLRGSASSSSRWADAVVPLITLALIAGCGGGAPKTVQVDEPPPKPAVKTERPQTVANVEKPASRKKESDIPFDAFFENPLEVADDKRALVATATPTKEPGAEPDKPAGEVPKATGGALDWATVLPMENLQAETKKIQNRLKASLQGQGTYNGNYKDIVVDGAVIAALAGIATEHSEDVSWKKNAPLIREFGSELSKAATGLGKENYDKSKAAFDKLESVFSGAIPADAPKASPTRPLAEVADRGGLMKRIEKARNHLRDNINTEAKLKADTDGIVHETLMISSLGRVVTLEGYTSADEEDYKQFAEALIGGANEATAAAKDQSFQKFTESMNKVNKSCDQCHANYGNG